MFKHVISIVVVSVFMTSTLSYAFLFTTKKYDNLSYLPEDIRKIAVVNITFDKRFSWSNQKDQLKVIDEHKNSGYLVTDDRDYVHLEESAAKIMETFKKGQRFEIIYGSEVVESETYKSFVKAETSSENIKSNAYQVTPYREHKFKKTEIQYLCQKLDVDAVATINFAYFYKERYTFSQKVKRNINPIIWFKSLGVILKAKEKHPNSLGLAMRIDVYNKKGKKIVKTQYFGQIEQSKEFRLPGYSFHMYPSLRVKISRATNLLINNADDFHTLQNHDLSPGFSVKKR
ncbi:MAG: hypothetical protein VW378_07830 [bacterium]